MRGKKILFGFLSLLVLTCADRDRINPLDPDNPVTLGRPSGLRAVAINDTVFLQWDRLALDDLVAIQIYRRTDDQADFTPLIRVDPAAGSFEDVGVTFGVNHFYQISGVGSDFESLRSDQIEVEPGPTFNWIADNLDRRLLKLSHDTKSILESTFGFLTVIDVEPNPVNGEVWALDLVGFARGDVVRVSPNGEVVLPLIRFTNPTDAAIHNSSGSLWVADTGDSSVVKIDAEGVVQLRVTGFVQPISVSVDQSTGTCWVADRGLGQVVQINEDGTRGAVSQTNFRALKSVSTTSNGGTAWVSDSTAVVRLNAQGSVETVLTEQFSHAFKLATNRKTGELWVLDWGLSTVSKFLVTGERVLNVADVANPEDLSINLFDGSCLVADTLNDRVLWIAADGQSVRVVREMRRPIALGVQNEPEG